MLGALCLASLGLTSLAGCQCEAEHAEKEPGAIARGAKGPQTEPEPALQSLALLDESDDCVLGHRGITLDLGSRVAEARRGFSVVREDDVEWVTRQGARFGRFTTKRVAYDFWIDRPFASVALSAKVHGAGARHLAAYIDGQHVGIIRLTEDKTRIARFPLKEMELTKGRHRLTLVFLNKPRRAANQSEGEISWLNLAETHPKDATDTPPTRRDTFVSVALDGKPMRALALRQRSNVHCPVWVPPNAQLRLSLGLWGPGKGQAEVVVSRDNEAPVSLGVHDLKAEHGWTTVEESLAEFAGQLVRLEFLVHGTSEGARVAFGEPRIERDPGPSTEANPFLPARRAVLVVLSGLGRKHAPPASRAHGLPALARFAQRATYFSGYRTPSTLAPAVMASLLTGQDPRRHGLEQSTARLPDSVQTIAQAVRARSGRAAFFTAVPTSFPAFGFDRGWERFEAISPVADRPATEPLPLAQRWLDGYSQETTPQLVVIHLRGAHPPFDVPLERARELPPLEYGGDLHPRRAAIQLAAVRSRPRPQQRKLVDEDWTRLEALQRAALEKQDAAVARLFRWLQDEGLWDDSLVAVLGDVTTDEAPEVPYAPHPPLSEARLHAPLLVKWPGGALAAHEISQPVTTVDLSRTVLAALGVEAPGPLDGVDLRDIARGRAQLPQRALFATGENSFATRAGEWLLRGDFGSVPTLCRLGPDPACVNDLLDQNPIAAASLWHWTYRRERDERAGAPQRVQIDLEGDIRAALTVWGYLP
ncbi:MAG: sulfatase-like hydrolase/transferase [Myxococcales bacterium]|nr:sulfatase-like hydrolase/transferase [Myxococcales bacterium]